MTTEERGMLIDHDFDLMGVSRIYGEAICTAGWWDIAAIDLVDYSRDVANVGSCGSGHGLLQLLSEASCTGTFCTSKTRYRFQLVSPG